MEYCYRFKNIEFDPVSFGTANPEWTKRKVKDVHGLKALADHICTRAPPDSYCDKNHLYMVVVERNKKALGNWHKGYKILTDLVYGRLQFRDQKLKD